jgi:hypothetical protein
MAWDVTESVTNAHRAVEARIVADWTDSGALRTPIQFPAVLGLLDTDGTTMLSTPPTGAAWLKVDILHGETEAHSRCGDHGMNRGLLIVQLMIFVPRQRGLKELNSLAGYAKEIFSRKFNADGLLADASSFRVLPDDRGYLVGMVRTPIIYFEQVVD